MLNEKYSPNNSESPYTKNEPTPGIHIDVHPAPFEQSLSLTQDDLDNGLTPDQLSWLFDNLNVRSLIRALAKIAPADEGEAPPVETSVDDDTR